jgi:hypothetical protein
MKFLNVDLVLLLPSHLFHEVLHPDTDTLGLGYGGAAAAITSRPAMTLRVLGAPY